MAAVIARCRSAWAKFRQLLPLLTARSLPLKCKGRLFRSCVRGTLLHASETWPMTSAALHRMRRNDNAMIRWICGVKPSQDPVMADLQTKLGLLDLSIVIQRRRLRWFGHVMRSSGEINRVRSRTVEGTRGQGRPRKTWSECVRDDMEACGLSEAATENRDEWRYAVRNSRLERTPQAGRVPNHGRCTRSSIK